MIRNNIRHNKKTQAITILIIIAVIIAVLSFIYLFLTHLSYNKEKERILRHLSVESLKRGIENCFLTASEDAIELMAKQGAIYDFQLGDGYDPDMLYTLNLSPIGQNTIFMYRSLLPDFYNFSILNTRRIMPPPCYPYRCPALHLCYCNLSDVKMFLFHIYNYDPSVPFGRIYFGKLNTLGLNEEKRLMIKFIENHTLMCVNSLVELPENISFNNFTIISFKINENNIDMKALLYASSVKNKKTVSITKLYHLYLPVRYKTIHRFVHYLVDRDNYDPLFDIVRDFDSFAAQYALGSDVSIEYNASYDGNDLFIVKDRESIVNNRPLSFYILRHNHIPILSYVGHRLFNPELSTYTNIDPFNGKRFNRTFDYVVRIGEELVIKPICNDIDEDLTFINYSGWLIDYYDIFNWSRYYTRYRYRDNCVHYPEKCTITVPSGLGGISHGYIIENNTFIYTTTPDDVGLHYMNVSCSDRYYEDWQQISILVEPCYAYENNCSNSIDDDCDGLVDCFDNDCSFICSYCEDNDHDGYCNWYGLSPPPICPSSCLTSMGKDCNDTNPAVHPGAIEVDNGIDDDCDGLIDEPAPSPTPGPTPPGHTRPDLVISHINILPPPNVGDDRVYFYFVINNSGASFVYNNTLSPVYIRCYNSEPTLPDDYDDPLLPLGPDVVFNYALTYLNLSFNRALMLENITSSTTQRLTTSSGLKTIWCVVDATNVINECNESNNLHKIITFVSR